MHIGYDGKRAVQNNTGLGNYSRLLAAVMARRFGSDRFTLYAPRPRTTPRLAPVLEAANVELRGPEGALWRLAPALWRSAAMGRQMRAEGVDLIHGLSGELPLGVERLGVPSVVTVHDVIFRRFPQLYKPLDRRIYDAKFGHATRRATRVLAISECTARDIVEFYGIPREKIDVVYQGCDRQFHLPVTPGRIEAVRRKYGLTRPYIISVGTIEERKNQMLAVKGLSGIGRGYDLVLAGRQTPYADAIRACAAAAGVADRVKIIEGAPFDELPALYAGAVCSAYTSRFEGLGKPVKESIAAGTPVVVASGSCLEEAAGPGAPCVGPDDTEGWTAAVGRLLDSAEERDTLVSRGREYIRRFSDEAMAEGTMACYRRAIEDFKNGKKY